MGRLATAQIACLLALGAASSGSAETWLRFFGGSGDAASLDIGPTGDVLVGFDRARLVAWLDPAGNLLQSWTLPAAHGRRHLAASPDGGFVTSGSEVTKYSATGEREWSSRLSWTFPAPRRVAVLDDGSVAYSWSYWDTADPIGAPWGIWYTAGLVLLDPQGEQLWSKQYSSGGYVDGGDEPSSWVLDIAPRGHELAASVLRDHDPMGRRAEVHVYDATGAQVETLPGEGALSLRGGLVTASGWAGSWPPGDPLRVEPLLDLSDRFGWTVVVQSGPDQATYLSEDLLLTLRDDGTLLWSHRFEQATWDDLRLLDADTLVLVGRLNQQAVVMAMGTDGSLPDACVSTAPFDADVVRQALDASSVEEDVAVLDATRSALSGTPAPCTNCSYTCDDCLTGFRGPSELDLDPGVPPLRVEDWPSRDEILLSWESGWDQGYALHLGSIDALAAGLMDHAVFDCALRDNALRIDPPDGSVYFLVTVACGADASYGRDSAGRPRPRSSGSCP